MERKNKGWCFLNVWADFKWSYQTAPGQNQTLKSPQPQCEVSLCLMKELCLCCLLIPLCNQWALAADVYTMILEHFRPPAWTDYIWYIVFPAAESQGEGERREQTLTRHRKLPLILIISLMLGGWWRGVRVGEGGGTKHRRQDREALRLKDILFCITFIQTKLLQQPDHQNKCELICNRSIRSGRLFLWLTLD